MTWPGIRSSSTRAPVTESKRRTPWRSGRTTAMNGPPAASAGYPVPRGPFRSPGGGPGGRDGGEPGVEACACAGAAAFFVAAGGVVAADAAFLAAAGGAPGGASHGGTAELARPLVRRVWSERRWLRAT